MMNDEVIPEKDSNEPSKEPSSEESKKTTSEESQGQGQEDDKSTPDIDAEVNRRVSKFQEDNLLKQTREDAEVVRSNPESFKFMSEKRQKRIADFLGETVEDLLSPSTEEEEDDGISAAIKKELDKRQYATEKDKVDSFINEQIDKSDLPQLDKEKLKEEFDFIFNRFATTKQTYDNAVRVMRTAKISVLGDKAIEDEKNAAMQGIAEKTVNSVGVNINRSVDDNKGPSQGFIDRMRQRDPNMSKETIEKYWGEIPKSTRSKIK
jgi:hypothetical protein